MAARKEAMTMNAASSSKPHGRSWKAVALTLGRAIGILCTWAGAWVGAWAGVRTDAPAQAEEYKAAAVAPAAWQSFAHELQSRFEQRLAADDKGARAFQDEIAKRKAGPDAASLKITVRTWVSPDGKVERLAFGASDDANIAEGLRALLTGVQVGPPPADMLQPLQLRMSLRPKDERAGGN
jgi:hypothetical protein